MTENKKQEPVTNGELRRQFKWQDIAIVLAILGGFLSGYTFLIGTARAEADGGIKPLEKQVNLVVEDLKLHKAESNETHAGLKKELRDVQLDIREFYKFQRTGQPSARLETPLPPLDGGGQ